MQNNMKITWNKIFNDVRRKNWKNAATYLSVTKFFNAIHDEYEINTIASLQTRKNNTTKQKKICKVIRKLTIFKDLR